MLLIRFANASAGENGVTVLDLANDSVGKTAQIIEKTAIRRGILKLSLIGRSSPLLRFAWGKLLDESKR
jgi:hypothetical protein